ncbi:hypothetical protein [Ferrimonas lipolytica]|uniref:Uncharacterized protein n=1 Tax=Ferrimonas lipolytica TaxID=2724191 RepID=A0A6H1UHM2_9GAMM|nr:hypothetical protein [Ferrimonas lipolytica]QIZ77716.1 hypothetical protein HER31_12900 [Ferrimonas lipolytica]
MFNNDMKKEALAKLEKSFESYTSRVDYVMKQSEKLMNLRIDSGKEVIQQVEDYINGMANTPKSFDKSVTEYKAEFRCFNESLQQIELEASSADFKAKSGAAGGVAVGAGVAAFAPTAAMALATTFGTASTGTAIASLGGAAATNAALAWLGGGALTAGGAGMAGGQLLLGLAGPIGWAIGATSVLGGSFFMRKKNREIAEEANNKRKEVETYNRALNAAKREIKGLLELTESHVKGVNDLLFSLSNDAPKDYSQFNAEQKDQLTALVNHIRALSELLNKRVSA